LAYFRAIAASAYDGFVAKDNFLGDPLQLSLNQAK